ncbi:MAG: SRPBCC family protein [Saccharospirillaceae bacterium]|nr:SRPBCC family protein [Pseudomonadales bacterium]NRB79625.1 SRPBCC family protein [Saccharospirillaceae bacterium]
MQSVSKTQQIDVPATRLWEIISDFQRVDRFHPIVEKVDQIGPKESGLGAIRVCNMYDKTSIKEEIIHWIDGQELSVKLTEGSFPFKAANATIQVKPNGSGTSEVSLTMEFDMKYGIFGKLMAVVMIKPMMKKLFGRVINSLSDHALTGKLVGKNGVLLAA